MIAEQPSLASSLAVQSSAPDFGAKNFSNNAPSWEALQRMVEERAKELNWQQPNLEEVYA